MTRLTPDMITETPKVSSLDYKLIKLIGTDTLGIAAEASGSNVNPKNYSAAVIPITAGLGVIGGFSDSVSAIVGNLGMSSFVTSGTDVVGMAEALRSDADIIFMADDDEFIAYNVRTHSYVDNTVATAYGYVAALRIAANGLEGKEVLVVGCGKVGTVAAERLAGECSVVHVVDVCMSKAYDLAERHSNIVVHSDVREAMSCCRLVINCSPAAIPTQWIRDGSVISSPGVPYSFDRKAEEKATIIHDPLSIGVSTMAVMSLMMSADEGSICYHNMVPVHESTGTADVRGNDVIYISP